MLKKIFLFIICCLCLNNIMDANPLFAFRVKFKDKNGTLTFADSLQFLSQKAMNRRAFQGIPLDSTDLPIIQSYIDTVMITANAVKLHNKSKWFNQIVIMTYDSTKDLALAALPMVQSVKMVARYANGVWKTGNISTNKFSSEEEIIANKTTGSSAYYGLSFQQVNMIGTDCLHDMGFMGQGMDIAVFDVNFRYTDVCSAFDSVRLQNRILGVHNFVKDTDYVFSQAINNDHGMNVFGCMSANIPGTYVGTAPLGNFYLFNSEDNYSEQPIEEDNWLSAAERADSLGVYLVNSSLGYNNFDKPLSNSSYTYADMTGHTTLIAQAANKLVSKGVFVVQAQGNEGASAWHYLLTPADGDSVYSVGSVNGSNSWGSSGYGPNFSGQIKPDGVALGSAVELIGGNCLVGASSGSSFASPIMCGSIACLWQAFPTKTVWELRQIVRMSSDHYLAPNNTVGYGLPNFCSAYNIALGVSDIKNIDYSFALYPNPTSNDFDVKSFDNRIKEFTYSLYDLQGKCIYKSETSYSTNFHSTALRNVANGEYVLLITTSQKTFSTKIIKK